NMAEMDATKALSGLLNGIAQKEFYNKAEVTEELLRTELFPETPREEFTALHSKMRSLLKAMASADMDAAQLEAFLTAQTRRQGGGLSAEQGAVLSRFWKAQRARVRESLLAQSRWEPSLRGLRWRVDLALLELELGPAAQDPQLVCLELDEAGVTRVLEKMADIQSSLDRLLRHA
uniref:Copper metabolism (Murr1) domain containing 1 n=1 Tax=Tetraodon nigroviridis TaxID=99883 RepID=H3CFX5_TETNG